MILIDHMEKKKKILLLELIVILMLIPAFVVYYEWNIAVKNNADQMRQHATSDLTNSNTGNLASPPQATTNRH